MFTMDVKQQYKYTRAHAESNILNFFNINFTNNTSGALELHDGKVSNGGRTIINLRVVSDIDVFAEEEEEVKLINRESCSLRMNYRFQKIALFHCMNFRLNFTYNWRGAWHSLQ